MAGSAVLLALGLILFVSCGSQPQAASATTTRVDGMTKIVRLPVQYEGVGARSTSKLTLTAGAEDEAPEGPASFDVLANGMIAVADPLATRVAIFDDNGTYRSAQLTGFQADGVWRGSGNGVLARDAAQGEWFALSPSGTATRISDPAAGAPAPRLIDGGRGFLPGRGSNAEQTGISVRWDESSSRLLAIERLGEDADGSVYVALEASPGSLAEVSKVVRKYAPDGRAVAEVRNIPLEYFVTPRDEFRVREGRLYQLESRTDEIRINIWDLRSGVKEGM